MKPLNGATHDADLIPLRIRLDHLRERHLAKVEDHILCGKKFTYLKPWEPVLPGLTCDVPFKSPTEAETQMNTRLADPSFDLIGFPDGSAKDSRAGIGSTSVFYGASRKVSLRLPDYSTSFDAELWAFIVNLEKIMLSLFWSRGIIFTDSQAVIAHLLHIQQGSQSHIPTRIFSLFQRLHSERRTVVLQWIPSHWGIPMHDQADQLAKRALERPHVDLHLPSRLSSRFALININTRLRVNQWWSQSKKLRPLAHLLVPDPTISSLHRGRPFRDSQLLTYIRLNWNPLNYYLAKMKRIDSPLCACGLAEETTEHYLFQCPLWSSLRPPSFLQILSPPILQLSQSFPNDVIMFIKATSRFRNLRYTCHQPTPRSISLQVLNATTLPPQPTSTSSPPSL